MIAIVIAVIAAIILLLLLYSVKIVYNIKVNNFVFSANVVLKVPFSVEIFNTEKSGKNKTDKKQTEEKRKKGKFNLGIIQQLKDPVFAFLSECCGIIKKHCKVHSFDTKVKLALEDPMENGIAFGIVSGIVNVLSLILKEKCRIKKVNLDISSDFNSGEGFVFENSGSLKIRPVFLLLVVLLNEKLISELKNIIVILKREEIKNG